MCVGKGGSGTVHTLLLMTSAPKSSRWGAHGQCEEVYEYQHQSWQYAHLPSSNMNQHELLNMMWSLLQLTHNPPGDTAIHNTQTRGSERIVMSKTSFITKQNTSGEKIGHTTEHHTVIQIESRLFVL